MLLLKLKAADLKPSVLAKAIGVTPQMAGMILNGHRGLSTWHLDAVAALLKTDLKGLFTDDDLQRHDIRVKPVPSGGTEGGSSASSVVQSESSPHPDALEAAAILWTEGQQLQLRAGEILRRHAADVGVTEPTRRRVRRRVRKAPHKGTGTPR